MKLTLICCKWDFIMFAVTTACITKKNNFDRKLSSIQHYWLTCADFFTESFLCEFK